MVRKASSARPVIFAKRLDTLSETNDLIQRPFRRSTPAISEQSCTSQSSFRRAAYENGQGKRLRHYAHGVELIMLAAMLERAARQCLAKNRYPLVQPGPPFGEWNPYRLVLFMHSSDAHTELKAPSGKALNGRYRSGSYEGMTKCQQVNRGVELESFRRRGNSSDRNHRIGALDDPVARTIWRAKRVAPRPIGRCEEMLPQPHAVKSQAFGFDRLSEGFVRRMRKSDLDAKGYVSGIHRRPVKHRCMQAL